MNLFIDCLLEMVLIGAMVIAPPTAMYLMWSGIFTVYAMFIH